MAKKYIRFHYTFSHEGLWLKSILDFSILFSHGGLWLKSISDFTIFLLRASVAKNISDFCILLATRVCG